MGRRRSRELERNLGNPEGRRIETDGGETASKAKPPSAAARGLTVEGLHKRFRNEVVLKGVSIDVDDGEVCVITGPSGCGKTVLLDCIAGVTDVTEGTIRLDGVDITDRPPNERDIGYVHQEYERALFPHLTVEENIEFALMLRGVPPEDRRERVRRLTDLMAITEILEKMPGELSGGQQQRVELCRHLIADQSVLLLDDPLSDLDYKLKKKLEREFLKLVSESDSTFIFVMQNQEQALRMGDQIVIMNQGIIEQSGPAHRVFHQPETAFVAKYLGHFNLFYGELTEVDGRNDEILVTIAAPTGPISVAGDVREGVLARSNPALGNRAAVSVLPESLEIGNKDEMAEFDNTVPVKIEDIIDHGNHFEYLASTDSGTILQRKASIKDFTSEEMSGELVVAWNVEDGKFLPEASRVAGMTWGDVRDL